MAHRATHRAKPIAAAAVNAIGVCAQGRPSSWSPAPGMRCSADDIVRVRNAFALIELDPH